MATGSLSETAQQALNQHRAAIDALDQQLIALLQERIEIVSKVGELKREDGELQCFIRSGREADMLRQIYDSFDGSPFSPIAACAIWRQIISASTQHERPMQLLIASHGYTELKFHAQAYFGEMMPMARFSTLTEAFELLQQQPASLVILPEPQLAPELWQELARIKPDEFRIFAQIPFLRQHKEDPLIYIAANLVPEPSQQDSSLFAIEDEQGWHFHIIAGYHKEWPQEGIATEGTIKHKRWLGSFATPLEIGDEL